VFTDASDLRSDWVISGDFFPFLPDMKAAAQRQPPYFRREKNRDGTLIVLIADRDDELLNDRKEEQPTTGYITFLLEARTNC
jgi:hypothetical protein